MVRFYPSSPHGSTGPINTAQAEQDRARMERESKEVLEQTRLALDEEFRQKCEEEYAV